MRYRVNFGSAFKNVDVSGTLWVVAVSLIECRSPPVVGGVRFNGPHAARCRRRASNACRRASRVPVRPAGRGAITGACGNALSASWLMDLTTAQAIISEKSIVLFCRLLRTEMRPCPGVLRAGVSGGFWRDSSGSRFRRVPANHGMRRGESCQQLCRSLVFLGLSDLPSQGKARNAAAVIEGTGQCAEFVKFLKAMRSRLAPEQAGISASSGARWHPGTVPRTDRSAFWRSAMSHRPPASGQRVRPALRQLPHAWAMCLALPGLEDRRIRHGGIPSRRHHHNDARAKSIRRRTRGVQRGLPQVIQASQWTGHIPQIPQQPRYKTRLNCLLIRGPVLARRGLTRAGSASILAKAVVRCS